MCNGFPLPSSYCTENCKIKPNNDRPNNLGTFSYFLRIFHQFARFIAHKDRGKHYAIEKWQGQIQLFSARDMGI